MGCFKGQSEKWMDLLLLLPLLITFLILWGMGRSALCFQASNIIIVVILLEVIVVASLGTGFDLMIFDCRVLVLTIGWIIFLSSFALVHFMLKGQDALRKKLEVKSLFLTMLLFSLTSVGCLVCLYLYSWMGAFSLSISLLCQIEFHYLGANLIPLFPLLNFLTVLPSEVLGYISHVSFVLFNFMLHCWVSIFYVSFCFTSLPCRSMRYFSHSCGPSIFLCFFFFSFGVFICARCVPCLGEGLWRDHVLATHLISNVMEGCWCPTNLSLCSSK